MLKKSVVATAVVMLCTAHQAFAQTNLIQNPSFETVSTQTVNGVANIVEVPTSWSQSGSASCAFQALKLTESTQTGADFTIGGNAGNPSDGARVLISDQGPSNTNCQIYQDVALPAGGSVTLTFDAGFVFRSNGTLGSNGSVSVAGMTVYSRADAQGQDPLAARAAVDLSRFAGQTVRFMGSVTEVGSNWAALLLDNIRLIATGSNFVAVVTPPLGGLSSPSNVIDLGKGAAPAINTCLINMLGTQGSNAVYLGQSSTGEARVRWNGQTLVFYPVAASLTDNRLLGLYPQGVNPMDVVSSCGTFKVVPALANPTEFGAALQGMGLTAQINLQGVITVPFNGLTYVVRPDFVVTPGPVGAPKLAFGADGALRFTDSGGNSQVLRPAILDPVALQAQVSLLNASMALQADGTGLMVKGNGQQFILTPDFTLTSIAPDAPYATWWVDSAVHYRYRVTTSPFTGFSQGITFSAKP